MFKLVIQDDEGKTTVVPLIRDEITIGRKEGNTIRLTERNVSRRHARIVRANGAVAIEDLGSYNGVRVNGTRIAQRTSLSVSDRVQIGDYLIELKAEGVETVTDDGKTQPIERMDPNFIEAQLGTASTMPPAMAPGAGPHGPPVPGVVALADTDPAARAIPASALAAVPMGHTSGHARLVVLSSNFAGQEWDLARPQMVVGRTDDNDIVVNHRSISRNHAKIVREPDTGRYTISDLQSSNGVRVNGEEYGKVELRRGDVVDLGHVRLRFVEPGEDFVFGRDAQIADVPTGGKGKGLMIAAAVALLGIGGGAIYMLTRNKGPKTKKTDPVVVLEMTPDASMEVMVPSTADAQATVPVMRTPDAAAVVPTIDVAKKIAECKKLRDSDNPDWMEVLRCAKEAGADGNDLAQQAKREAANKNRLADLEGAARAKDNQGVRDQMKNIPPDSVYYEKAKAIHDKVRDDYVNEQVAWGRAQAGKQQCRAIKIRAGQAGKLWKEAGDALDGINCKIDTPEPECRKDDDCTGGKACKSGACVAAAVTPVACDAKALLDEARQAGGANQWSKMYQKADASLKCENSKGARQLALMAACRLGDKDKAKKYWKEFENNTGMRQICIGIIGE